jgi:signal transduction histidine kinase
MEPAVRVCLIDDDEEDFLITRDLLRASTEARFELTWVAAYDAAVEALRSGRDDVYLVDYRLGADNGLELIKAFATSRFPMIMLTGAADRDVDLEAMRSGAMDYLVKGRVDAAVLERAIRYAIARKRTEEALRRKDEFLSMLAHELRNPLAPIRTALHLLDVPEAGAGTIRHAKEVLRRQVDTLVRLVDDLLDISRIMQRRIELRSEVCDVVEVARHAAATAEPVIDARGQRLNITASPDPVLVNADPVRLSQAVGNLLVNAAKHSDRAGEIRLHVQREGSDVVIRVRDSGAGIDPGLLPRVFEPFVQGDRSLARPDQGLGLGLTLVKGIVELHGGTVSAFSAGRGTGSEFVIRIPAAVDHAATTEAPRAAAVHRQSRHVLVVDDNVDAAELIGTTLQLKGHRVHMVHDGFAAIDAARHHRPDVILLDIGLPGRDGYEVARLLRAESQFAKTKIVALTGYGQQEDQRRAKEAGMDQHLTKPVDPEVLDGVLDILPEGEQRHR